MSYECDNHYGYTPEGRPNPNMGKILMTVAGADGELAPEEWATIEYIARIMGVPQAQIDAHKKFDYRNAKLEDLMGPDTPTRALVYDTLRAAGGDGVLSGREKQRARKAAKMLGVDDATVSELEDIVEQEYALRQRKRELIFPGGKRK